MVKSGSATSRHLRTGSIGLIVILLGCALGYFGRGWVERPVEFPAPSSPPTTGSRPSDEVASRPAREPAPDSEIAAGPDALPPDDLPPDALPPDVVDELLPTDTPQESPASTVSSTGDRSDESDESDGTVRLLGRVNCSDPTYLDFVRLVCEFGLASGRTDVPIVDGEFELAVEPGTVRLALMVPDEPPVTRLLDVREETVAEFTVEPPVPERDLVVTVLGPDGEAVRSAEFELYYESNPQWGFTRSRQTVRAGPEGTYLRRLGGEAWAIATGAVDARCVLVTRHPRLGWNVTEVERGDPPTATVRYEAPGVLEVSVDRFAGRGWEGVVEVQLREAEKSATDTYFASGMPLDADGAARIAAIPPGDYVLTLRSTSGAWIRGYEVLDQVAVRLESGEQHIALTCPALHSLELEFDDPSAIDDVIVRGVRTEDDAGLGARPPPSGDLVFEFLPPGEYELVVHRAGLSLPRTVQVPGPKLRNP